MPCQTLRPFRSANLQPQPETSPHSLHLPVKLAAKRMRSASRRSEQRMCVMMVHGMETWSASSPAHGEAVNHGPHFSSHRRLSLSRPCSLGRRVRQGRTQGRGVPPGAEVRGHAFSTSPSDVVHRFVGVGAGRDFDAARQCEALCMSMSR
jgi:hypothetical protein